MEAVVLEALGNVDGLDTRRVVEGTSVKNEFVSAAAVLIRIQNLVVRLELGEEIVGVEKRDLCGLLEPVAA